MLADRDALFAGILAAPHDDLPRLVFADHLEESGHPALVARAAYIRAQIDAANAADEPSQLALTRHAAALRWQFRDEADAVLDTPGVFGLRAYRRRGFVAELRGPAEVLGAHAAAVFAVAPVTALHFETSATHTGWVRSAAYLRHVTTVRVGGDDARDDRLDPFIESPHLGAVEHLDLSRGERGNLWLVAFLPRLAAAPIGRHLTALDLSHNALHDPAAALLTSAGGLDGLTRLDVSGNRFTDAGRGMLRRRFGPRVRV